jgi:hypothetical protein
MIEQSGFVRHSRFHPDYQFIDAQATPEERARVDHGFSRISRRKK